MTATTDLRPSQDWVSVTDVGKIVSDGDGLLHWANKLGLAGKTLKEARQKRGALKTGNVVHNLAEKVMAGAMPEMLLADVTEEPSKSFAKAFMAWWEETSPTILHRELTLRDPTLMVRGRIDYVRQCRGEDDGGCPCHGEGVRIGDFKTGSHKLYISVHVQVDGYLEVWPAAGPGPKHCCGGELVTLGADGKHEVHPCRVPRGTFRNALALKRSAQVFEEARL